MKRINLLIMLLTVVLLSALTSCDRKLEVKLRSNMHVLVHDSDHLYAVGDTVVVYQHTNGDWEISRLDWPKNYECDTCALTVKTGKVIAVH